MEMRDLPTFRCPKCEREQIVEPLYGNEVVSVFHVHREGGLVGRRELVRMQAVLAPAGAVERELAMAVPARA